MSRSESGEGYNPVEQVGHVVNQAVEDIGAYIRQQREGAQVSLRQLAKLTGVSNPYLSQVERGLRKPSAEILQQIAKGLRISAEALYVRAGILERRPANDLADAVLGDPELTERQKQVLLDVYRSFRRENEQDRLADWAQAVRVDGDGSAQNT
jgi:transcriptional regulator with XRE-family HTH domain